MYNAAHDDQLISEYLEIMRKNCAHRDALQPEDVFTLAVRELAMDPQTFTILPNVNQLVPEHGEINPRYLLPILGSTGILSPLYRSARHTEGISIFARALNNLRTQPRTQHAFILGNATLAYDPANPDNYAGADCGAHWIAVRARNEGGTIVLYIKDSQSGNGGTRPMIDSLKKIIKDTDTLLLEEQASLLRSDLRA